MLGALRVKQVLWLVLLFVTFLEECDMDLQDIDFEDEVDGEPVKQEIKPDMTAIRPKEEKIMYVYSNKRLKILYIVFGETGPSKQYRPCLYAE